MEKSLQQYSVHKFCSFKPPPPAVEGRTSRDVTLSFSAGVFECLEEGLLYRVEKKEKIPPWVLVYSGGKSTKTIENLPPSHPHRFRVRLLLKPSALPGLADALCTRCGGEAEARRMLDEAIPEHQFEEEGDSTQTKQKSAAKWLQSRCSDETWTGTESDGTSAASFCMAVRCGHAKLVQQMLEERPILISTINYINGYTPLATAVRQDDINMVRFLLSMNAEIEQCSSTRQTPLHLAVLCGHLAIADLLLEKGADLQAQDLNLLRVEHYAVDSCKLEVMKFVLERGGDVGVKDSNGWTPLFRAVCQGAQTAVIAELVRAGSDVRVTDKAQLTLVAAARLLTDRQGRRRESVLRLVDTQYQHEKVIANFSRLTKKISSVQSLLKI